MAAEQYGGDDDNRGTPRWVKVSGIVALVAVLLLVVLMATGLGGKHGPGRHMRSDGAGDHTAPAAGEHRP